MNAYINIDPDAKSKVDLAKIDRDVNDQPFYIGKLQFPGTLEFEPGVSFMVFISEEGNEQLHISPLDPSRLRGCRENATAMINHGKFSVELHPMEDQNGKTYYVGEALGFFNMDLRKGIFFTVFTSRPGQEEIQISRLNAKRKQRRPVQGYPQQPRREWPPQMKDVLA